MVSQLTLSLICTGLDYKIPTISHQIIQFIQEGGTGDRQPHSTNLYPTFANSVHQPGAKIRNIIKQTKSEVIGNNYIHMDKYWDKV